MNKVICLLLLAGIGWLFKSGYAQLEDVMVINGFTQISEPGEQLFLVDTKMKMFEFTQAKGFLAILKTLWPVWTAISFLTLICIPFGAMLYFTLRDSQIDKMKQALNETKRSAKTEIEKAKADCDQYKAEAKKWAENLVQNANERAHKELKKEFDNLRKQERSLIQRESGMMERENKINELEQSAHNQVQQIKMEYQKELERFSREMAKAEKSKRNAVATMKRRAAKQH